MTMHVPSALLAKHDRPGPRYTSYPTAPSWSDEFGPREWHERLHAGGLRSDEPLALYVHVPFCESLCWYCGCSVVITQQREKGRAYVERVLREAALVREIMTAGGAPRPVVQHHWGGGTPTFLAPDELRDLFLGLNALFPVVEGPDAQREVSIEIDPRVTTVEQLRVLREVGFDRVSMGVQDFDPAVQETINRVQSYAQTRELVDAARELGFTSVNLDLVYGLPLQTSAGFARTLELVREMRPERIACYGYAHVPWLKKNQRALDEATLPSRDDKLALYLLALEAFTSDGWEPVGMDHFARRGDRLLDALDEGFLHRNFMGYTALPAEDMIAFGTTAIAEVDGAFAQNRKQLGDWNDTVDAGELTVERGLVRTADDSARRRIILDLMCRFALRYADHEIDGEAPFVERYADALTELTPLADDGLLTLDDTGIHVTPLGRLFVRNVCMPFDAHLAKQRAKSGPMFSRTV